MEIKKLKIIDKEYLQKTILDFENLILKNKYFNKSKGDKLVNNLNRIFGIDGISNNDYDGELIEQILAEKKKTIYFIDSELGLPNVNDVKTDAFYVTPASTSVYIVYTDEQGIKSWKKISSQNVTFEKEDIDFETSFNNFDVLSTNPVSFINFEKMYEYIKNNNTMGFIPYDTNIGYSVEMQYNKENYEMVNVTISLKLDDEGNYIISNVYRDNTKLNINNYDELAQTIIDKEYSINNGGN